MALSLIGFYLTPYIQKNLKTSNILLDANLRAKLADFGLAINLENDQDGGFQSTRHDSGYSKLYGPLNTSKMESAPKLDVLASGVVMLELLSGKEAGRKQLQPLLKRVQVMSCSL
jgi:serine/threonine protein kinase